MSIEREVCPGCGILLPYQGDAPHAYLGASGSCWSLYGTVLAREYQDMRLMAVHRLTVDAYAAQHPGLPGRRSTQSVRAHLTGLYLVVERKLEPEFARRVIGALGASDRLTWLTPPSYLGALTVLDLANADTPDDHLTVVRDWASSVWAAWGEHHAAIEDVAERVVGRL